MNWLKRAALTGVAAAVLVGLLGTGYLWWKGRLLQTVNRVVALLAYTPGTIPSVPFQLTEIDDTAGDIKLVGDIDLDGFPDLVIAGMPFEPLTWYAYPSWMPHPIAAAKGEFTTDGALGDVDGDGDLDVVVPDGRGDDNLLWFQNPLPSGDPTASRQWTRHVIGSTVSWCKDVELADLDGDGRLDVATRTPSRVILYFQTAADTWSETTVPAVHLGTEGMASGDVDGDGSVDLVVRGAWLRNPGGDDARTADRWAEHTIGAADTDFKALVVDLDQDGRMDVLFSSSENTADVDWWTPTGDDPAGPWTKHTILPSVERAHTLQAADMDLDGDVDVVLAQMHTSSTKEIMVLNNLDGKALTWRKEVVATVGLHNGVVADIGNDGDFDIYGANWAGNPPLRLWENRLETFAPVAHWTYKQVTAHHAATFGLAFGDVDGDGRTDIVSGRFWYRNPGAGMLGDWTQSELPAGMEAALVLDVDGDDRLDVIAQKDETEIGLYWLEPTDAAATAWSSVAIGKLARASHALGSQGYRSGQIEAGGREEVVFSSGDGISYFRVPANPGAGDWPRVHVSGNPSDEGFAIGDIDGDGDLDVAATTGESKRVEWYRNPGDGSAEWTAVLVGDFAEAVYPDRTGVADFNQDGRLDIIVTEENGSDTGAETCWWEQPSDPLAGDWTRHLVTTQASTNSLDVADLDGDGDPDLVLAEHRGDKRVSVWLNDGKGGFLPFVIDAGKESHLGARTVDLDGDGDLDIVSIALDEPHALHLWRNDAPRTGRPGSESARP